jgi:RNA-binding protein
MLDAQNKKKLRAAGQSLPAVLQIGKQGLSENTITNLEDQLEAHELVKVSLLKSCDIPVREAAIDCAAAAGAEVVHIIGRTFLLFRRSKENKFGIRA